MKAMEKFMGPSNIDLNRHSLTYNLTEIIKPLLPCAAVDSNSVSKKKSMVYRGSSIFSTSDCHNFELFDRLYDSFVDPNSNKRQSGMLSSPIRPPPNHNDLGTASEYNSISGVPIEDNNPDEDFEESEFDISVLQINNASDDAVFEKLHDDVKDRILLHLQTLLGDW